MTIESQRTPSGPPPPEASHTRATSFPTLVTFVDVVYAAVLGYVFLRIAEQLRPYFHDYGAAAERLRAVLSNVPLTSGSVEVLIANLTAVHRQSTVWPGFALDVFVLNFLVGRFVEGRILTQRYPYKGRSRFILELLTSFSFLLAFVAAEERSVYSLAGLAGVFVFGGMWAIYLYREYPDCWPRPQIHAGVCFASAVLCLGFTWGALRLGWAFFTPLGVSALWMAYLLWLIPVRILKRRAGDGDMDADMITVTLVDVLLEKTARALSVMSGFFRPR